MPSELQKPARYCRDFLTALAENSGRVRIWRKQNQDVYNRETLLRFGLLRRVPTEKKQHFGPELRHADDYH